MPQIANTLPFRPITALPPAIYPQIRAFREHHQPHWHQLAMLVGASQLTHSSGQARLIGGHFPGHENEAGEAETEAYDGDVGNDLLEHDDDVAVEFGGGHVGCPPEVDPIAVDLWVESSINGDTWLCFVRRLRHT